MKTRFIRLVEMGVCFSVSFVLRETCQQLIALQIARFHKKQTNKQTNCANLPFCIWPPWQTDRQTGIQAYKGTNKTNTNCHNFFVSKGNGHAPETATSRARSSSAPFENIQDAHRTSFGGAGDDYCSVLEQPHLQDALECIFSQTNKKDN